MYILIKIYKHGTTYDLLDNRKVKCTFSLKIYLNDSQ